MAIGILGKKIGMIQLFREDGKLIPVTLIETSPCTVLQVKNMDVDGYCAVQLGFEDKKTSKTKKPQRAYFEKIGISPKKFVAEIRVNSGDSYKIGQEVGVEIFNVGDFVDVTGISIGKGFQGGVKRWHWKGGPESHGSMSHRAPGSIGASSFPSRVLKGHHLPGRMGGVRRTVQNLEVVKVDKANTLLVVKGAVPGPDRSYLIIKGAKKKKKKELKEQPKEQKKEQPKEQKKEQPKEQKKETKKAKKDTT